MPLNLVSQVTQPPFTPTQARTTEVDCQTPARSTSPNSCSTGSVLWEFFRKSAVLQGKVPCRTGEKVAKIQILFFCLKVRGGSLPSNCVCEAPKLVSTKTLFLKHDSCRQGFRRGRSRITYLRIIPWKSYFFPRVVGSENPFRITQKDSQCILDVVPSCRGVHQHQ